MYSSQPCQKFLEIGKLFPRLRLLMAGHDWLDALFSGSETLSRTGEGARVSVSPGTTTTTRHDFHIEYSSLTLSEILYSVTVQSMQKLWAQFPHWPSSKSVWLAPAHVMEMRDGRFTIPLGRTCKHCSST